MSLFENYTKKTNDTISRDELVNVVAALLTADEKELREGWRFVLKNYHSGALHPDIKKKLDPMLTSEGLAGVIERGFDSAFALELLRSRYGIGDAEGFKKRTVDDLVEEHHTTLSTFSRYENRLIKALAKKFSHYLS